MKKLRILLISIFLIVGLSACNSINDNDRFSDLSGIDINQLELVDKYDSHGGFHNDGVAYYKYAINEYDILNNIKNDTRWEKFPLSETVNILLYGNELDGVYIVDESQNVLMPKVNVGYYLLIDRHSEASENEKQETIFDRYSLNYTVVVYDIENNFLYICEQDT